MTFETGAIDNSDNGHQNGRSEGLTVASLNIFDAYQAPTSQISRFSITPEGSFDVALHVPRSTGQERNGNSARQNISPAVLRRGEQPRIIRVSDDSAASQVERDFSSGYVADRDRALMSQWERTKQRHSNLQLTDTMRNSLTTAITALESAPGDISTTSIADLSTRFSDSAAAVKPLISSTHPDNRNVPREKMNGIVDAWNSTVGSQSFVNGSPETIRARITALSSSSAFQGADVEHIRTGFFQMLENLHASALRLQLERNVAQAANPVFGAVDRQVEALNKIINRHLRNEPDNPLTAERDRLVNLNEQLIARLRGLKMQVNIVGRQIQT